nr:Uncharacterised protein [Raoultella sp. NCTC 9187]
MAEMIQRNNCFLFCAFFAQKKVNVRIILKSVKHMTTQEHPQLKEYADEP